MKVSKARLENNRRAILAAAGRLFRERGFAAVGVSEVMQAAGLTHGAFYGYFPSKDALIAATLAELTVAAETGGDRHSLAAYLSPAHRDDCAGGCPVAGLGADAIRQPAPARAAMTEMIERMAARLAENAAGESGETRRRAGLAACAAMVGALILSRAVDDPDLSQDLLSATSELLAGAALRS